MFETVIYCKYKSILKCFYEEAHFQKMGPKAFWDLTLITRAGLCRCLFNYLRAKEPNGIALAILNAMYLVSNLLMVHKNYQ